MKNKFKFFPLVLVLFSIAINSFAQNVESALRLLYMEQTNKALTQLNEAVKASPEDASLLYYLGYAQLKAGDKDKASASFDKGIQLDEKEGLNHAGKGHILMLNNNPVEAKTHFDKALSVSKSKDVRVLRAVAEGYLSADKFAQEALNVLTKTKNPNDAYYYIVLGDTYLKLNNGGQAVSSYEKAASINPKLALAHYKIGMVYQRSKNYDVALESFNKAIQVDPEFTLAHKELGEMYYVRKEADKAVQAYEKYLALTENPGPNKLRYAFFLFMAKNYAKANEIFKELSQAENTSPLVYRYYAYSLFESGNVEESQKVFEKYFAASKPEDLDAGDYAYYGKLLQKTNNDSLALINFEKSLALDSTQVDLYELRAETYFNNKKYAQAAAAYEDLIGKRSKPLSKDYYNGGRAFYLNEEFVKADSAFTNLIELQPNMTISYLWGARAKAALDPESTKGLAKPLYEQLIEKASAANDKNKNAYLVEAYEYLGYYYLIKNNVSTSKSYWQKVQAIDPDNVKAKEALKAINNPPKPK